MADQNRVKTLLLEQFDGKNAHILFDEATEGLQFKDTGICPQGLPHSIWELAEHIRIAQYDILDFCRNPDYEAIDWPDSYWPDAAQPEDGGQWQETIQSFKEDHQAMAALITDPATDVLKPLDHGDGQTLFREAMLIIDHNAYHIGQIVQVRRLLGCWNK